MQKATASPAPKAGPAPKPAAAAARAPAKKPAAKRNANLFTIVLVLGVIVALLGYAATRPRDPWVFDSPEAQSAKRSPRAM